MNHPHKTPEAKGSTLQLNQFFGVFTYSKRALGLVWQTSKPLTLIFALATLMAGALPAVAAYLGQLIIDAVLAAIAQAKTGDTVNLWRVLQFVALEALVITGMNGGRRVISACQSLLRALLGQRVNEMILEKAELLSLTQFEDSEFYDKLTRARREASARPLSLVNKTFGLLENAIALVSYALLLLQFSGWVLAILVIGAIPVFIAEAKFSGDAFRLFRWRSPERRMQMYLETLLAREDTIKEVKLFQLNPLFLQRYKNIFRTLYDADKNLTLRRDWWGFALGLLGTLAFYGAYGWIIVDTVYGKITLGEMTMYLLVFKQGQTAISSSLSAISGMYEDNLYLSTLYEYLEQPITEVHGNLQEGPTPGDGIRFEHVTFHYPGKEVPALHDVNLHIRPGQSLALVGENGSGKTTLIKLLTRLYQPSSGRIMLDGANLEDWDPATLHQRIGVIFQDFVRYQLLVGENIGAGDVAEFTNSQRWQSAAKRGMADQFIDNMPLNYNTQLGRWFNDGQELSGGQWQKIALARAFMREKADILVLDEPTAAMDAQAEATIFEHFQEHSADKIAILISHRFSTVRKASHIVVIDQGRIIEDGTHEQLLKLKGRYQHLFELQAAGYR